MTLQIKTFDFISDILLDNSITWMFIAVKEKEITFIIVVYSFLKEKETSKSKIAAAPYEVGGAGCDHDLRPI